MYATAYNLNMKLRNLDHVQLAIPDGSDAIDCARVFYGDILSLTEVEKPDALSGRGGLWFETGNLRLHLGVERPFRPAKRAHPGVEVDDLAAACRHLERHGITVTPDCDLPGIRRVHIDDPFGNRIELLQRIPRPA